MSSPVRVAWRSVSSSVLALTIAGAAPAFAAPKLEAVAQFAHQVTGVTVSETGRIFVNFPRWTEDSPVSVAEVDAQGKLKAFPDAEWNSWRNAKSDDLDPRTHFVCVQSVVADGRGGLWVLDPAAPAMESVVPNGPKLVRIDLASNKVAKTIPFDESAAPQGSYLNDVRFSPDGRRAYMTDSGAKGALVVVDLEAGTARRVLDGHPSTQAEKGVVVQTDGKPLRRPDGKGVSFNADGLALAPDGKTLYWQAIKGHTLYRIPTAALDDAGLSAADVASKVERVGDNGVADGLLMDRNGETLYVTAPEQNAVKARAMSSGGAPTVLVQDKRLRWPDTMSQGPDGTLYVTTSRIQDSATYKPGAPRALPTTLWRITTPSKL